MLEILIYILLGIGIFFNVLAGVGLLRFPDVYTRLHAGTKCTTFGSIFICGSVVILGLKMWYQGSTDGSVLAIHTVGALVAILLTNPTGAHAIARAAHKSGVEPVGAVVDSLRKKSTKKTVKKKTEVKE
ncbi:MAG: monovalent cation/H(+) antiporter subunit G [Thermoplasmatales archaeon]|jgi:multicomponent Na+:H+ antiporter subunit G|nr:monovalent cation/H(+) antiporter subunit G [Thermoplasmatales archaeon]MCK5258440.1 monovalent cation/H(+) antiporter subunit G [Thermoplasmatales archaeon]